ncbi:MAG: M24 family metallopeptidase [Ilumatobacteraceae bacterium]
MTADLSRVERVRRRCAHLGGLVVSDASNIRWLTGFTGSSGVLVVAHDQVVLVTDGRYGLQATEQIARAGVDCTVAVASSVPAMLDEFAARCRAIDGPLGFEADHVSVTVHEQWRSAIGRELVAVRGVVEEERRTKDATEVALIARAAAIADAALGEIGPSIVAGVTEAQLRNRLELRMREMGASGPSYDTIVAAGPHNSALPHHRPTDYVLRDGDTVVIDVGALVEGYHSDMTRSFVVGGASAHQREMYDLVLESQRAGLAAVRPGAPAAAIDAACRGVLEAAGVGEWFSHGTGHGVGLLIHEEPFLGRTSSAVLREGDVVTVEPGVYREGFGGIRIEDLVLVTDVGCRSLTASPKDDPCPPSPPTI